MTNNKSYELLGKGIRLTPIYQEGRLSLEFTTQGGAKAVFTTPQAKGGISLVKPHLHK